jgi:hypothetical protein
MYATCTELQRGLTTPVAKFSRDARKHLLNNIGQLRKSPSRNDMQVVYWAHSYRDEDAPINHHFGMLIEQAEHIIVNFDPPSKSVNESKLDQNLRTCDGMVAVLSWRSSGPSQYILHEIALALRARKPLLVFVDDQLPDILPGRILQRRFSHRTYFRQLREHTHALRSLKSYMGDPPPIRYQPNSGQRTCGFIGLSALDPNSRKLASQFLEKRKYRLIDLEHVEVTNPLLFDRYEHLANLDIVLSCVDSRSRRSTYWTGAVNAAAIPMITITTSADYPFSDKFPREFQPRQANVRGAFSVDEVLEPEFALFEQDFLKAEDASVIERYTRMQVAAGALAGHYEVSTRQQFTEVIMGDKYDISGQAGAVGPRAHAHDLTFNQIWNQVQNKLDLTQLANELQKLHEVLEREATEPSQKLAAGAVAAARQSARQKDGPKALEYLKTAGTWALGVAEKIGVDVATEALKGALGL